MPINYHNQIFPPESLNFKELMPYAIKANNAISTYQGILWAVPNANILLSPLTTQEAVLSSKIEGTQATMGEVLDYAAGSSAIIDNVRKQDIHEVLNYRKAMHEAEKLLKTLPVSLRLIRNIHSVLLSDVRGGNKSPGEFRKVPNWIGPTGCSMDNATFIPISADKLQDGLKRWESFINNEDYIDPLIQIALAHVEFEALHPFFDGNGRVGRMLIPILLWQKGLISQPTFYISAAFERNRDEYYERLLNVSSNGEWEEWCIFFLKCVKEEGDINILKARKIIELYNTMKTKVAELTKSSFSIFAVDAIFNLGIFNTSQFCEIANLPQYNASRILNILLENNIIKVTQEGKGRRATKYVFPELLNIAEGKNVF